MTALQPPRPRAPRARAPREETAEMLALREEGMTYRKIADKYGLAFSTVHNRLGLKPMRRGQYKRPGEPGYHTL